MIDDDLGPAQWSTSKLLAECHIERTRRGGPGGQHRNKVESAVVITHRPSGVVGQASERRDQSQNLAVAIQRLRIRLALAVRSQRSVDEIREHPDPAWHKYVRGQSIRINPDNPDFPGLLSEMLDVLAATHGDPKVAAMVFCLTASQVVKFLKSENASLELVNRWRHDQQLGRLQ